MVAAGGCVGLQPGYRRALISVYTRTDLVVYYTTLTPHYTPVQARRTARPWRCCVGTPPRYLTLTLTLTLTLAMAVLRRYMVSCGGREEQAGYSPLATPPYTKGYTP